MRRIFIITLASILGLAAPARAYVEAPMSLGAVIAQSIVVCVIQVEKVDKAQNIIIYRKVMDVKGKHPQDVIKHTIKGEIRQGECKEIMSWAEPGKMAIFFHNGGASETCTGLNWYQAYAQGDWWGMSHGEPFLLRSYAGKAEKLPSIVKDIMDGKEVLAPCMVDGNKDDLHKKTARIQRVKASLKLQDYNPKRDFAGWGGEDIRKLAGMPGFTQIGALGKVDAEGQSITCVDFDGDGKLDICISSTSRVLLLQNQGDSFSEVYLPGFTGGSRSTVWADYNGDGKPDVLLATVNGPKLYTNLGGGQFRDDSALLPQESCYDLTAAAWLDADGDGMPDILLANGFHGLRLYRNKTPAASVLAPFRGFFEDVSAAWGLGPKGMAGSIKGDTLAVADVNGDGKPDFLYGAGKGMLFINTGKRFEPRENSGLDFKAGKTGVCFADFNGDGHIDLFIPQNGKSKLYQGDGTGNFIDVTAKSGDLAKGIPGAVSAAWGDFNNDGRLDLMVGCLRGPNRYFEQNTDGTFTEKTDELGLNQKTFNTQAIALADLNGDGKLDLILNNEGQDSAVLFGNKEMTGKCTQVVLNLGEDGSVGTRIRVLDKDKKVVAVTDVSGGESRGGQPTLSPRFTLPAGNYLLEMRYPNGKSGSKEVTVADSPLRVRIGNKEVPLPMKK